MKVMPFNFDRLDNNKIFVSNLAGFHHIIEDEELSLLTKDHFTLEHSIAAHLESKFFVTHDNSVSLASSVLSSGFAKRLMNDLSVRPIFMIVPTLRCDHTCKYCQVSRAAVGADGYDLDSSLIPEIVNTIKRLGSAPYKIEVQGGEPLLRFDLVQKIYHECESVLGRDSFEMVIATSLSLLNTSIAEWVKNKNITFSVSLDGNEHIHNKNRILPGTQAHKKAIAGIQLIREKLGANRVATVTTVTKELTKEPASIVDAHLELGLTDMFIRPVSPYGFAQKQSFTFSMPEYFTFYKELMQEILIQNKKGIPIIEHSAAIHIKRIFNPNFSGYADLKSPSGVVLNCILFNYDGKVYGSDESRMLQKVNPDADFSAGTFSSMSFSRNEYYQSSLASSFNFAAPGCDTCAYQPFCGADPCQNISVHGEPLGDKSKSTFCQYHKGMFRYLLNEISLEGEMAKMLKGWAYV
ncbi:MAG: His-Xaa-Ser system radical SAM maturase HxsB [Ewingella americana]|jgi:His-Xaa-Ser system radical SAM maturase HxsB|uniref:His-Xaa-Ser system radical SAM maturase HxsB n=1 Tax=Ewingella americana TaxID=41202 RepID=UPI00242D178B|nr:His-Xaa-Ser system radical SAM maturase HxsB [Ewingella americana]MCI1677607.1 His-Xaa-Ser system radical SAM maturase HxsB [Ewingella americana]MCI1852704.1 His-Xaa-Ser system radical SAM maturase HxsB [Ewingella americana]MCI1861210.1 His-Xaa-Ser system radical SAM maturase HxsB [Ewingella americana]MCI2143973.1 His-Xaa-Ser system radical SAM maturase HxsB [Ewingella americana]MCI2162729.1 His-Xaa-Ser system radical SAM maturase HxsB [Ewingella americana]